MKLSIRALTFAAALLWGGCVLILGLINLAVPTYGTALLGLVSSIYPGFHNSRTFVDVVVGTGYAMIDGGLGGLVFGWLYNVFSGSTKA